MNDEQEAALLKFAISITAVCLLLTTIWLLPAPDTTENTGYTIETTDARPTADFEAFTSSQQAWVYDQLGSSDTAKTTPIETGTVFELDGDQYKVTATELPKTFGEGGLFLSVVLGLISATITIFVLPSSTFSLVEAFTTVDLGAKSVFIILSTIGLLMLLSLSPITVTTVTLEGPVSPPDTATVTNTAEFDRHTKANVYNAVSTDSTFKSHYKNWEHINYLKTDGRIYKVNHTEVLDLPFILVIIFLILVWAAISANIHYEFKNLTELEHPNEPLP